MQRRFVPTLALLLVFAPACADRYAASEGGGADGAADGATNGEGAEESGDESSDDESDDEGGDVGDTGGDLTGDEQLCLDRCLSGNALGCNPPWAGEVCYTRCLNDLERADMEDCATEVRDAMACEATASDRSIGSCESEECLDEYKRHDLCRGYCSRLGGIPGSGSGQTQCTWRTDCPAYGHDFEVECSVGNDSTCDCLVDDEVVASCDHGGPMQAFSCDEDLHVFSTCCRDVFEGVLFE